MTLRADSASLLRVEIDNPKNKAGNRKGKDISDHFPIIITESELRIVSYNIQFMPTFIGGVEGKKNLADITQAVSEITEYFVEKEADVCCVQELFDNKANELMEKEMLKKGYVATNRVGSASLSIFNGGARTFVKQELAQELTSYEHLYKNKIDYLIGADALANKGVTHTCFKNKDGTKSHIFNTHLQAFYPNRDHYAEITLAQCIELKKFIELQKAKGIIGPNDKIVLCGDFNIPKADKGEKTNFLYEKMKRILGPQFTFLDNSPAAPGKPIHTLSHSNSYNEALPITSDMNITVDLAIKFDPQIKMDADPAEAELSELYGDIQLAISHYVRKKATFFTKWLLPEDKNKELIQFNEQVKSLMNEADEMRLGNKNPLDDEKWFTHAVTLLSGPGKANRTAVKAKDEPDIELQESIVLAVDDSPIENLEQAKERFDTLMHNLKQLHARIHKDYIESPNEHHKTFATSLKLNHVLLNAGDKFFKNPSPAAFSNFQKICNHELAEASKEFEQHASIWGKLNPILKGIIGIIAGILAYPTLLITRSSTRPYVNTFFSPLPAKQLTDIKKNFEEEDTNVAADTQGSGPSNK